jgi:2,4-diaminopentanoate dehydrogenase
MQRILHIGVGPLGQRIMSELIERKLGTLVGVVDVSPEIAGQPVNKFAKGASADLRVVPSLEAFKDWDQVDACVVTTSSDLRACAATFRTLIEHGKAVVSTCEELVFPWLRHKALADELHALAMKNGGKLLGTGVNPGFLMDALPTFATAVCKSVRGIRVYRIQDASSRRIPFQKKIGVGLSEEEFRRKTADGSLRHVGLGESLHFLSHYIGIPIERCEEDLGPVRAERDIVSALGVVPKGGISGVRQVARGYHDEGVSIHLEFQAAVGQLDPYDRIVIDGEPSMDLVINGGVHGDVATCAITLNAVARLRAAAPGLHTMATVPLVSHQAPAANLK